MACEPWTEKLDAYFDGELPVDEARALHEHMRQCAACAAESLGKLQQKRAVQAAGQRFTPDPVFRARIHARIQKSIATRRPSLWSWRSLPVLATAAALLIAGVVLILNRERGNEQQLLSELVDQHVASLASPNPVDVVSTDRHTVKPWFEGKIPFTFNLPDLQDSPFVLEGGRVSYLRQSPGAELIFRLRLHKISVFIFQERGLSEAPGNDSVRTDLSFEVRNWSHNGLRYFVVGDASSHDLDKLSDLIKAAG
jgi:anti-sigma factor RsiW